MKKLNQNRRSGEFVKRKRKTVKGMTLVECIIALLVFTVSAAIMVVAGSTAARLRRESVHIKNKTEAEMPIANVRDVAGAQNWTDSEGNEVSAVSDINVTVGTVSRDANGNPTMGGTNYATYDVKKYNTAKAGQDALNANTVMDADLEFYVVETLPPSGP